MNWETLWLAFLIFLPAGAANATPVFANKIPILRNWKTPLDFGMSWRGKRILGNNKSWRGLVTGVLIGILFGIFISNPLLSLGGYVEMPVALMAMLGFGALVGDAVESFFKRRLNRPPGVSWFPFDQIDYIIGGLLFSLPFGAWDLGLAVAVFIIYFGLHLTCAYIAYLLGLKDKPI